MLAPTPYDQKTSTCTIRPTSVVDFRSNTIVTELNESQTRREELLSIGRELFADNAYDELSIDEIARRAGVAKGLLYYYFGSKRGFYVAVVEHAARELGERIESDPQAPPAERLLHALDAYLAYVDEVSEGYRAFMAGGIGSDPEVRAILLRERRRVAEQVAEGLTGAREMPPALRTALEGWLSFIEGVSLDWLAHRDLDRAEVRALLLSALGGALAGVRAVDSEVVGDPRALGLAPG
jgi:AcrR family transcriptional regulator